MRVLISGATGGLGTYVTRAFLDAGAEVIGLSRSASKAEFPDKPFQLIAANVVTPEAARKLMEEVGEIDSFVHLAGGFAGGTTVESTPMETLDRMLDTNLRSAFLMMGAVLPGMRMRKTGSILAIGTRAVSEPVATLGAYAASKAALVSLIRTVAVENAALGITANVILPGTLDTPANRAANPGADFRGWVPPGDVANLLVHLASNRSVTGAVIPIARQEW
ncbi:MAG: SDR family NAD(P)-dependent oxidoreductase [Bryobacteraceae bacterium]|nr:SDR family NAD(P)-dependent oxidoreductase [Bryobacteraceae bacterium]